MLNMQISTLRLLAVTVVIMLVATTGCIGDATSGNSTGSASERTIVDSAGRGVEIPIEVDRVVCSSGGTCVRYLAYIDAADRIIAVESDEQETSTNRAYVIANPQFADLPVTGSSRGVALDLEQVVVINPQVIFTMGSQLVSNESSGALTAADTMQTKTGIPVITIASGSFQDEEAKARLYSSFRLLGEIFGKESRAEELIAYTEATLADLDRRTADIPESEQKTAFIGGLSYGGAHGLLSTQSEYMPFIWCRVKNIAIGSDIQNIDFPKESLVYADPEYIFIDAGTLNVQDEISAFEDIQNPMYANLRAVQSGNVYATLPYT
ncbi:MAG: ABC transporter substrate-binding protein, partial [Methanomicrobiales archaeon]|nr:ABC transporter substrate-binding protein [Methanomicrobiales archaeon]